MNPGTRLPQGGDAFSGFLMNLSLAACIAWIEAFPNADPREMLPDLAGYTLVDIRKCHKSGRLVHGPEDMVLHS